MKLINNDCEVSIVDPNGDCNSIVIKYYTVNPSRPLDAQQIRTIKIEGTEINKQIFLCEEKWDWDGRKYIKTGFKEERLTKSRAKRVRKILKYISLEDPEYFSMFGMTHYKPPVLHLGDGCSWTRPAQV